MRVVRHISCLRLFLHQPSVVGRRHGNVSSMRDKKPAHVRKHQRCWLDRCVSSMPCGVRRNIRSSRYRRSLTSHIRFSLDCLPCLSFRYKPWRAYRFRCGWWNPGSLAIVCRWWWRLASCHSSYLCLSPCWVRCCFPDKHIPSRCVHRLLYVLRKAGRWYLPWGNPFRFCWSFLRWLVVTVRVRQVAGLFRYTLAHHVVSCRVNVPDRRCSW